MGRFIEQLGSLIRSGGSFWARYLLDRENLIVINRDIYTSGGGNSDEEEIKFLKMAVNGCEKSDSMNQRIIKNEKE